MWGWNECGQLGLPCPALEHTRHHSQQQGEPSVGLQGEREKVKPASLHLVPQCVDVGVDDADCRRSEDVVLTTVACGTRHTAVVTGDTLTLCLGFWL